MEKHCFCSFFALPSIRQKGPVDLFYFIGKTAVGGHDKQTILD